MVFPIFSALLSLMGLDGNETASSRPARIWSAALAIYCLLLLISAFPSGNRSEPPSFSQAPGYSDRVPRIGETRVVPLAKSPLRSPVSSGN